MAILNFGNLFALDNTKPYANAIFGDSHTATIVKTCKSRTERIAAAIFINYLAENCGGVWTQAGHLPASLIVQSSDDLYLNNQYYKNMFNIMEAQRNIKFFHPLFTMMKSMNRIKLRLNK